MSQDGEWESTDWLSSARSLVQWVNERSTDNRTMLFLRHSHREIIPDHSVQFSTGLTDLGKQTSYEMGIRLPVSNPTRIFFSFIPRCYQTAEELSKAIKENAGDVIEFEPVAILVMPEFEDEKVWENLQPDGKNVTEFVNRWADGEFGDMIQDFEEYKNKLTDETLGRLMREETPVLHIHVSHDLGLMAMKRILLQRPVGPEDREPYLGGMCFTIDMNGLLYLFNSGNESPLTTPE